MLLYVLAHLYSVYSKNSTNCDNGTVCNTSACDMLQKISTVEPVTSKCERRPVPTDDVKLNDSMARNDYVVVGRDTCEWCQKALTLLRSKNLKSEYLNLDTYPELYTKLSTFLNYLYVPIIIHKGAFIGGYTELLNCLTEETICNVKTKTNETKGPVVMPPADSYLQVALTEPAPKQPCTTACESKTVPVSFQDVQVGPSNAQKAIDAMNLNQQADLMFNVQQNQQTICQLEEQKRNSAVAAQQVANVAQQKFQEANQAAHCANQTAQNIAQQQQDIQEHQKQLVQTIETTTAQQRAIEQQKIDCQIAQQQDISAQKAAEIARSTQAVQLKPVQEPLVVVKNLTPLTSNTTGCAPELSNPLRTGETQNVQSQLTVQPLTVTSTC